MEQKSLTALVSAFSRAYHSANNEMKVFDDNLAKKLLSPQEYNGIAAQMAKGIGFFNPGFIGSEDEALRWIVDNQLSPTPLERAAFSENSLKTAVKVGAKQYLIFAAGYDTFAYRAPEWAEKLKVFEIDHPLTAADKKERLKTAQIEIPQNVAFIEADFAKENPFEKLCQNPKFKCGELTFCSVLGLSYYLSKAQFKTLLCEIGKALKKGSSVAFDIPDENSFNDKAGIRTKKQAMLAAGAKEDMKSGYSYKELEGILERCGFGIYEFLTPNEITEQYFKEYNAANPDKKMTAFDNVNLCLAVRQ